MNIEQFNLIRQTQPAFMLYFYSDTCGVCKSLWTQVQEMINNYFPKIKLIKIPQINSMELAGQLQILTIPGMILFLEGKEYFRASGMISVKMLKEKISRPYNLMFQE
jgi:thioredoxin 1